MARIAGVEIPDKKQIWIGLTYIYGIGRTLSLRILREAGISPTKKISELTPEEINKIQKIIEKNYKVEGEAKREILLNIKRLKEIGCYRGLRHIKGLPVRGQTTRRNSRTVRGNVRKTVATARKAAPAPK
jgi:small subunit ribosomal protein S13